MKSAASIWRVKNLKGMNAMKTPMHNLLTGLGFMLALLAATAHAQQVNPDKDVYFGTTHGHSSWSID